jgi:hypothetical protein
MTEKKNWNSLEGTKLAFSLITPIALFYLGVSVQRENTQEQRSREEAIEQRAEIARVAAQSREELVRREARAKEFEAREEARREARLARDEVFQREKALRGEAFARERTLRQEAEAKEERRRRSEADRELFEREQQKKAEVWAQVSPVASRLTSRISHFSWDEEPSDVQIKEMRTMAIDLGYTTEANSSFLSTPFIEVLVKFRDQSLDVLEAMSRFEQEVQEPDNVLREIRRMQRAQENSYQELIRVASVEISLRWQLVPENVAQTRKK